jgi:mono/diheme cytochrome c family protein
MMMESAMRVSKLLGAALCAGALLLAGNAPAEPPLTKPGAEAPESAESGEALFGEKCAACHSGAVAPAPSDLGKLDAATFDQRVKEHPQAGVFAGLSGENLNEIYLYLQSQAED